MNHYRILVAALSLVMWTGCDDETTADIHRPVTDAAPLDMDVYADVSETGDTSLAVDASPDTGPDQTRVNVPEATPSLVAGVAERSLGFPVGIGTVGYSPGSGARTRFAVMYPGTNAQHTDLTARALVMRNGGKAIALVRTDTVGVWQDMVRDIKVRLKEEGRGDLADGLIIGATHTHSSGGRIFDHFIGSIAVGPFLPGMYLRVRDSIVESVLAADALAEAARIGHSTIQVSELHKDRRCENPDVQDDTMGIIKVERTDGTLLAVAVNYAMHGTVLTTDDWTLSRDASGAVEAGIEARLGNQAPVLFFQSWAGDMAPKTPEDRIEGGGHDLRPAFTKLDAIAASAAEAVVPALVEIETTDTPRIDVVTVPIPLDAREINPDGSFDDFAFGGIYCLDEGENCGPEAEPYTSEDLTCLTIPEVWTVDWTYMTAARIGDFGMVTLPGEPLTSIGTELRDRAVMASGLSQVFVLGYAQGYLAYLLHPDDFWMGGYEGASSLMGPGFGVYLIEKGQALAGMLADEPTPHGIPTVPVAGGPALTYEALTAEQAMGETVIEAQSGADEQIVWARWVGGSPVTDAPLVSLEYRVSDTWEPVLYPSGKAVTSGGAEIELSLEVDPSYDDVLDAEARTFRWTARMPTRFSVTPSTGQLQGTYRFVVQGTQNQPYRLETEPFDIGLE